MSNNGKASLVKAAAVVAIGAGIAFWLLRGKQAAAEGRCPFSGAKGSSTTPSSCPHSKASRSQATALKAQLAAVKPFQPRAFTPEMLARCDGSFEDPLELLLEAASTDTKTSATSEQDTLESDLAFTQNMVCISAKGIVYKVTPQFYGPGEPYSVYAGKDISRALAIGRVDDVEANLPWSQASADAFKKYYATHAPLEGMEVKIRKAVADEEPYDGELTEEEVKSLDLWTQKYDKKYQIVGWYTPFAASNEPISANCTTAKAIADAVAQRVSVRPSLTAEEVGSPNKPITQRRNVVVLEKSEAPPSDVIGQIV